MLLWVDDVRQPPSDEWVWIKTVKMAKTIIHHYEHQYQDDTITIDLDHDAGDFSKDGGDYIEILNWLEREGIVDTGYFFHIQFRICAPSFSTMDGGRSDEYTSWMDNCCIGCSE